MKNNKTLLQAFCDMYNRLDVSCIEGMIADNLIYESQRVIEPLKGKDTVLDYLKKKFQTIANSNSKLTAGVAFPEDPDKNVLLLTQGDVKIGIVLTLENELVSRIDIVEPAFLQ